MAPSTSCCSRCAGNMRRRTSGSASLLASRVAGFFRMEGITTLLDIQV
jgi:hypothetical protein